jgi:hypothetical protein
MGIFNALARLVASIWDFSVEITFMVYFLNKDGGVVRSSDSIVLL